jgi:hypothetical protein
LSADEALPPSFRPLPDEEPPAPARWLDPPQPHRIGAPPSLQALADEPVAPWAGERARTAPPDVDRLPLIPLKPLDRDETPPRPLAEPDTFEEDERDQVFEEAPLRDRLEDALLQSLSGLEVLLRRGAAEGWVIFRQLFSACWVALTGWIGGWARRERRSSAPPPEEPTPWPIVGPSESAPWEPPPSVELREDVQVLADEPAPARGSARLSGFTGWVDRLTHSSSPPGPIADEPLAPTRSRGPVSAEPHEALKAPVSVRELPTLRFAEAKGEPEVTEDVYEDEGEGLLEAVWFWAKRLVVVACLVAGGLAVALNWETWWPQATRLARVVFVGIDEYTRSKDQAERQQRARQEAAEQLPHLDPETIGLVLSSAPAALDPPEVFRLAYEAAERGMSGLTPGETEELRALQRQLLDTLRPTERERVRAYDRARSYRAPFAFEDQGVLALFARGARALPAARRARLQELSGKAIAAGLAQKGDGAPR